MDLTEYVDALRGSLTTAAAAGGEQVRDTARLLADALEPAVRLTVLDALAAMAAEVTAALDGDVVEIRVRGREPEVVVTRVRARAGLAAPSRSPATTAARPASASACPTPSRAGPRPPPRRGGLPQRLARPRGRRRRQPTDLRHLPRPRPPPLHRLRPKLTAHP